MQVIISMLIFGSISIFVRKIDLPSGTIALLRGLIGSIFLYSYSLITKKRISYSLIKENLLFLLLSGASMGFNWIFLFQAYKNTTVSNTTLTYYFAPTIVMLMSPIILKEKLNFKKFLCVVISIIGLFMIVNTKGSNGGYYNHPLGISYGLMAAVLYAAVIILNKFFKKISGLEATIVQLACSALVLAIYVLIVENPDAAMFKLDFIPYILILGIVYTGITYSLYFTGIQQLKGQTIAMLSYIDPISAVIISTLFLNENITLIQFIGGILILGSGIISEKVKIVENEEAITE